MGADSVPPPSVPPLDLDGAHVTDTDSTEGQELQTGSTLPVGVATAGPDSVAEAEPTPEPDSVTEAVPSPELAPMAEAVPPPPPEPASPCDAAPSPAPTEVPAPSGSVEVSGAVEAASSASTELLADTVAASAELAEPAAGDTDSAAVVDAPPVVGTAAPAPAAPSVGAVEAGQQGPAGEKKSTPLPPGGEGAAKRRAEKGKILEGVVTAVTSDEVELTLDDGRAAVINRHNFAPVDQDPSQVLSPGDRAFGAELSREDPKKRVVLSRSWALKRQAWDKIMQVAGLNEPISGKVISTGSKGVVVDVGVRGFVPTSHLELESVTDLKPYLHQVLELKVLEADPKRERLVLSRRSLLQRGERKKAHELLSNLKPGDERQGTVTSITNYGAFVDIGGVNGLVHLSELSWRRVRRPQDVVSLGEEVAVRVLDVKVKKRRVSLSIRRVAPDPLTQIKVGEIMRGPVTRLVDFGAFVGLGELEGLVHLSELSEYRVSTPEEVVAPGDEVGVKVLSIDRKRRRIELSIRQAAEYGG